MKKATLNIGLSTPECTSVDVEHALALVRRIVHRIDDSVIGLGQWNLNPEAYLVVTCQVSDTDAFEDSLPHLAKLLCQDAVAVCYDGDKSTGKLVWAPGQRHAYEFNPACFMLHHEAAPSWNAYTLTPKN